VDLASIDQAAVSDEYALHSEKSDLH
jgi:hypothetical protein